MTVELITGFADTPHVDAADDGALNAAILGNDNYVVQGGNQFQAAMRDANHITIGTGEAVMGGRHVHVTSAEDVTIASGSQGLKRHDIVGIRYSRNSSTSVETAVLDVIRGTASSTPADPALPTGNILTGASSAFMPLYRVPLDGITVGTPVPLFNVLRPMSELWDSVTQAPVVQAGTISAKSNALAVISLKYASPNGRPPDSLVVSLGPFDVEASAKQASVMVWSMTAEEAQIRVRRNYDGNWWASFQATISWIAVWNHV